MIRKFPLLLIVLTLATTPIVRAHSVWIEPGDSNQLIVRFAEPGNDFETSPGHLDALSAPMAFTVVTNTPVGVEAPKKADCFLLVGASRTNAACLETSFTVRGGRKPLFYARWQPDGSGTAKPLLTLDLVPTGKPGEVGVYFRGQPLGGIKAALHTPDEKETELTADAEGFLCFPADQHGQYLLTIAHHREPLAGFHVGVAYKETSHNCSLTWVQP
jgi:hypothetical protein